MKLEKEAYIANYEDENLQTDNGKLILFKLVPCEPLTNKEFKKYFKMKQFQKIKLVLETEEPILDEAERKYLSGVIRPFRDKVKYIEKNAYNIDGKDKEYISIRCCDGAMPFPSFDKGTMYKNMEQDKEYTLEELEL